MSKSEEGCVTKKLIVTKRLMTTAFVLSLALGAAGDGPLALTSAASGGLSAVPAQAAPPPSPAPGGERSEVMHTDTRPQKPLSLKDAIEAAVANNLTVAIHRKNPESARWDVIFQGADFDPQFQSQGT